LKLAVAICSIGGVFQMELTGSDYHGCPDIPVYLDSDRKPLISMGGEEYLHFIKAAWVHFNKVRDFRNRRSEALLVHDRGTPHRSKVVKQWLEEISLKAELMPPRSPDLMPLDYGIFGTCKTDLDRRPPKPFAWEARVARFKDLIAQAPVKQTVGVFEKRLSAVVRAGGGHIDLAMKEVKNG
jgi:hypothetical protein